MDGGGEGHSIFARAFIEALSENVDRRALARRVPALKDYHGWYAKSPSLPLETREARLKGPHDLLVFVFFWNDLCILIQVKQG